MKRLLVGVAIVSSAVSAQAADLAVKAPYMKAPVAAVYDWTGFYIGANAGVGVGRDRTEHFFPGGGTNNTVYLQPQGGFGGGQIGYNWQTGSVFGPLLFGVEADIQGGDISDSRTTLSSAAGAVNYNRKLDWFATARGRIGLVTGSMVSYVTGGYAVADIKTTVTEGAVVPYAFDRTQSGWVIGSGVEAALGGNWTGKIEYLYLDLGNRTDVVGTQSLYTQTRENIFRAGLNYRIGGNSAYVPLPASNWTGFYLGGNIGGANARNNTTASYLGATDLFSLSPDGYVGGGQIGYNWQAANWVFGLEADFQGSTQRDDRTAVLGPAVAYDFKLPWLGTARGRLGYSVGSTLVYGTGGYAYGNVKTNIVTLTSNETFTRNRSGWTAGAGIESPFTFLGWFGPNWTSKSEYLYVDLGSTTDIFAGGAGVNTTKVTEHILRTGINYHFNQPVVARY